MDDFVVNVRQIAQYPSAAAAGASDVLLLQQGGLGGSYASVTPAGLFAELESGGPLGVGVVPPSNAWNAQLFAGEISLAADGNLLWNAYADASATFSRFTGAGPAAQLNVDPVAGLVFYWAAAGGAGTEVPFQTVFAIHPNGSVISSNTLTVARDPSAPLEVATMQWVANNTVASFNGRTGAVQLETPDILRAGGAPIWNANFGGHITAPTVWDFRSNDDTVATTAFVQLTLQQLLCGGSVVTSFNGRGGAITLTTADVNAAYATIDGSVPTAPNPALGDASNRIATTLFVDDSVSDLQDWTIAYIASGAGEDLSKYALLDSPNFSGIPTAPTATAGSSTGQLATTAFVQQAIVASTTGVASFNTRTGAVTLTLLDVTDAGGAPLASPGLTGTPTAPTVALHNSSTAIATTAYVQNELSSLPTAPVTSFNGRTGDVVLTTADITGAGGAPELSPALTGTPTAPTAAVGTNTTQLATTAFVDAAIGALGSTVQSFNSRTGAVTLIGNDISAAGGALLAGPAFTGVPTAPTATVGTATTQLATTAFVHAAIAAIAAGVTSFNTRTGVVTLTTADITGAGGAPIASPNFSGAPTAPTAPQTSNDTTVATTAYVRAALAAGNVVSWNGRTGAVTLQANDLSAVGGALLAGPAFSGAPTAPTAVAGTSTTQLATTAFVAAALASVGGVTSFNGRAGAVTMTVADVNAAGGPYLPMTGGTLSGTLSATAFSVVPASGPAQLYLIKSGSGTTNQIVGTTGNGTALRWMMEIGDSSAESGGNVGSDFSINRYNDAGAFIATPFKINRSNGQVLLNQSMQVGGNGITYYNAYPGHYIAFGWTGTVLSCYVDNSYVGNVGGITSDARIKNVLGNYQHGLAEIEKLQPVNYTYRGNNTAEPPGSKETVPYRKSLHYQAAVDGTKRIGLIAQACEAIMPELVLSTGPGFIDGVAVQDIKGIDTTPLFFALINAVKELSLRVRELEVRRAS